MNLRNSPNHTHTSSPQLKPLHVNYVDISQNAPLPRAARLRAHLSAACGSQEQKTKGQSGGFQITASFSHFVLPPASDEKFCADIYWILFVLFYLTSNLRLNSPHLQVRKAPKYNPKMYLNWTFKDLILDINIRSQGHNQSGYFHVPLQVSTQTLTLPPLCPVGSSLVRPLDTLFSSCQFNCPLSGAEQRITSLANDVCCCYTLINILHVIILCPLPQQIKL